jgi:PKD repeat protein
MTTLRVLMLITLIGLVLALATGCGGEVGTASLDDAAADDGAAGDPEDGSGETPPAAPSDEGDVPSVPEPPTTGDGGGLAGQPGDEDSSPPPVDEEPPAPPIDDTEDDPVDEPVGDPDGITISGVLVDAQDPSKPIADALIYLPEEDSASASAVGTRSLFKIFTRTDSRGRYCLRGVPRRVSIRLCVKPPEESEYASYYLEIDLSDEPDDEIEVPLPCLTHLMKRKVKEIAVEPGSAIVREGQTLQFEATPLDWDGNAVDVTVRWIVNCGIGRIDHRTGLFTAGSRARSGYVRALVHGVWKRVPVTVRLGVNEPPTCALSLVPTSGEAPVEILASITASDVDAVSKVTLDWGDGTVEDLGDGRESSHVYRTPGEYPVTATAIDDEGAMTTATRTVTVHPPTGGWIVVIN